MLPSNSRSHGIRGRIEFRVFDSECSFRILMQFYLLRKRLKHDCITSHLLSGKHLKLLQSKIHKHRNKKASYLHCTIITRIIIIIIDVALKSISFIVFNMF